MLTVDTGDGDKFSLKSMLYANDEVQKKDSCIFASPGKEDKEEATSTMVFLLPQQVAFRTPKTPVRTPITPNTPVSHAKYQLLKQRKMLV